MLLIEGSNSATEGTGAAAIVVGNEGGTRSAVPGVVGPGETTVRDAVDSLLHPVVDVAHVPVRAVVLAEFTHN